MKPELFWPQVDKSGACWMWTGRIYKGYGAYAGRKAHRVAYELLVGPIPDGLEIDHLCGVTACVNPDHLEPVTRAENMRRRQVQQTHCINGHEFNEANTYWYAGARYCRRCNVVKATAYRQRRRAAS